MGSFIPIRPLFSGSSLFVTPLVVPLSRAIQRTRKKTLQKGLDTTGIYPKKGNLRFGRPPPAYLLSANGDRKVWVATSPKEAFSKTTKQFTISLVLNSCSVS